MKKIFLQAICYKLLPVLLLVIGIFLMAPAAHAEGMGGVLGSMVGWIAALAIAVLGKFFGVLVQGITWVGSFQDIINATPVVFGWVIVRDIANMFFIVVLLFIAIGTLLGHEEYEWHKTLPRFIGSIILINFSKTIAGFFIDFSQVITLTFINAITNAGEGNFAQLFGVDSFLSLFVNPFDNNISQSVFQSTDPFTIGASMVFAAILLFIAVLVLAIILAIFVFRLIVLWFLVVLFPIAILAGAWPGERTHAYYKEWWEKFSNYLTVGPVLSFFVWLALMSANYTRDIMKYAPHPTDMVTGIIKIQATDAFIGYVVGVGMLVIGLEMTTRLGVVGGNLAGSALGWLEHTGASLLKLPALGAFKGTLWTGATVARKARAGAFGKMLAGVQLNPFELYHSIAHGLERKKEREETLGIIKSGERFSRGDLWGVISGIGAEGAVDNLAEGWFYWRGLERALKGTKARVQKFGKLQEETEQELKTRESAAIASGMSTTALSSLVQAKRQERLTEHAQGNAVRGADGKEYTGDDINALLRENGLTPGTAAADAWLLENFDKKTVEQELQEGFKKAFRNSTEGKALRERLTRYRELSRQAAALKPEDFIARSKRRERLEKESKKNPTTNEYELISDYEKALEHGIAEEVAGVALQATRVGHLNELIQATRAKENWYYDKVLGYNKEKGELLFRKGDFFSAGHDGFSAWTNQVFVDRLHLDQQSAWSIQNDLSNAAEGINHWFAGQSIEQELDGTLFQRARSVQQLRVAVEQGKKDFEDLWRRANRLGFFTEQLIDPTDDSKGRMAVLNEATLTVIKRNWLQFAERAVGQKRLNPSAALHMAMPHNMKLLAKLAEDLKLTNEKKARGDGKTSSDKEVWDRMITGIKELAGKEISEAKANQGYGDIIKHEIEEAGKLRRGLGLGAGDYRSNA